MRLGFLETWITQQTDCIIQDSPEKQNRQDVCIYIYKEMCYKRIGSCDYGGWQVKICSLDPKLETQEMKVQVKSEGTRLENSFLNREATLPVLFGHSMIR